MWYCKASDYKRINSVDEDPPVSKWAKKEQDIEEAFTGEPGEMNTVLHNFVYGLEYMGTVCMMI